MKWMSIFLVAISAFISTMARPELLAENDFLKAIASHEIVSILVVILTVTMASVANIHLALGRLKNTMADAGKDISDQIADARVELSDNAWYLFGAFCLLIIVLLFKGWVSNIYYISAFNGIILTIIALNLAILFDIYSSVYLLTSLDNPPHPGQNGNDGSEVSGDGSDG